MPHPLFLIFIRHFTKDKFLGDIKDNAFEQIKNFLVSQIYGIVVSILVVKSVAGAVIPKNTYIKKVSGTTVVSENEPTANDPVEIKITELYEEDYQQMNKKMSNYFHHVDRDLTGKEVETQDENGNIIVYDIPYSQIFADMSKTGISYSVAHDIQGIGTRAYAELHKAEGQPPSTARSSMGYKTNDELTSDLAIKLRDAGFEVAENTYSVLGYYDGRNNDFSNFYELTDMDFRFDFNVVFVKIDGNWYVAEDRLI